MENEDAVAEVEVASEGKNDVSEADGSVEAEDAPVAENDAVEAAGYWE